MSLLEQSRAQFVTNFSSLTTVTYALYLRRLLSLIPHLFGTPDHPPRFDKWNCPCGQLFQMKVDLVRLASHLSKNNSFDGSQRSKKDFPSTRLNYHQVKKSKKYSQRSTLIAMLYWTPTHPKGMLSLRRDNKQFISNLEYLFMWFAIVLASHNVLARKCASSILEFGLQLQRFYVHWEVWRRIPKSKSDARECYDRKYSIFIKMQLNVHLCHQKSRFVNDRSQ